LIYLSTFFLAAHKLQFKFSYMALSKSMLVSAVDVKLDGCTVALPPLRRSFAAIRSHLEAHALKHQRILCALNVDGEPVNLLEPRRNPKPFTRIEGETMSLEQVPAQLISAALQQTASVRTQVQSAVELMLINDAHHARELWWSLALTLKEPLLTLSLLPENYFTPAPGSAPFSQLRAWQLEQLGTVIQQVDEACESEDPAALSDILESRALPWLDNLHAALKLWLETALLDAPGVEKKTMATP
jgi:hypothetical protein